MKATTIVKDGRFPVVALLGLSCVWLLHVVLTELGDPLGLPFDVVLWLLGSGLKVLSLVALPIILGATYSELRGSPRRSLIAFGVWALVGTLVLLALARTRETWAGPLSNDAVWYYSPSRALGGGDEVQEHQARWHVAWASGEVVSDELALVWVLAAVHALVGFKLGGRPGRAVAVGYTLTGVALVSYLLLTPWSLLTYDNFHGDIFAGAVFFDSLFFFVANDPYTTIALPFYLSSLGSAALIIRLCSGMPQT